MSVKAWQKPLMVSPKLVQGVIFIGKIKGYFSIKMVDKKKALSLSVNVFSTKVLIGNTIFTFPTGDGTTILSGHPSHTRV